MPEKKRRNIGCTPLFPEAAGCILVGALAGIVVRLAVPDRLDLNRVSFDGELFLSVLLPPITFQATLAIDKPALGKTSYL